jgi:hypothetical protein
MRRRLRSPMTSVVPDQHRVVGAEVVHHILVEEGGDPYAVTANDRRTVTNQPVV